LSAAVALLLFTAFFPSKDLFLLHSRKTCFLAFSASGGVAALRGKWIMRVAAALIEA